MENRRKVGSEKEMQVAKKKKRFLVDVLSVSKLIYDFTAPGERERI